MSLIWMKDVQSQIFTIVSVRTEKKLKSKYPDLFITSKSRTESAKTSFPTVYLHKMQSGEHGRDIEQDEVNAFMCAFQIEVTASKTQGSIVGEEVIYEVLDQFKKLHFIVQLSPEDIDTGDTDSIRYIARVHRMIGSGDTI